jgi:sugar lactone lactonase YvrE
MYVAGHRTGIFRITPQGDVSELDIDVGDAFSIAVFNNYVYWTDSRNNRVGRAPITADGVGATEIVYQDDDGTYMDSPSGMAIDIEGNVYVVSKEWDGNRNLSRIRTDGTAEVITELPSDNNRCIAFYGKYVYVTTQWNGAVYKVYVGVEGAPPYAWGP